MENQVRKAQTDLAGLLELLAVAPDMETFRRKYGFFFNS
jgi:hypothetical protein